MPRADKTNLFTNLREFETISMNFLLFDEIIHNLLSYK